MAPAPCQTALAPVPAPDARPRARADPRQIPQIDRFNARLERRLDDLHGLPVDRFEGGAPGFVAANDLRQTAPQGGYVQRSTAVDGYRFVIKVFCELAVQPNLLLRKRKRCRPGIAVGNWRRVDGLVRRPRLQVFPDQILPALLLRFPLHFRSLRLVRATAWRATRHRGTAWRRLRSLGRFGLRLAPNLTRSDLSPRNPRFERHSIGSGTSVKSPIRRKSASNTTCPSTRASGAPKQKCAAQPKARWRLSLRECRSDQDRENARDRD